MQCFLKESYFTYDFLLFFVIMTSEVDTMNKIKNVVLQLKALSIHTIQTNSSSIQQGDAFLCIKGLNVDRHDYIEDAISRGASAIIAQRPMNCAVPVFYLDDINQQQYELLRLFYDFNQNDFTLIGITGTDGKTSTATIIENLVKTVESCGYIGTNGIYSDTVSINSANTTPSYETLMYALNAFKKHDTSIVAMEVSSEGIHAQRITDLLFDFAVFTNLSPEHLNTHNTMEDYFLAKAQLFKQLKVDATAIINGDDVYGRKIETQAQVVYFGMNDDNDYQIKQLVSRVDGLSFILKTPDQEYPIDTNLIGAFNAYNLTAALIVCLKLGYDLNQLVSAMNHLSIKGRMNRVVLGQSFEVIIDYAHTPNGLTQLFNYINTIKKGRSIVVIGSAGGRDAIKRPEMGHIVSSLNDWVVFTQEDPRFEDPQDIVAAMVSTIETHNYDIVIDRRQAIEHAIKMAQADDIVLILGKGQENYQMIGNTKIDFNDLEVACETLKDLI